MLSLRILRGSRPAALGRWALVGAASAGTGLLLLSSLGWALAHPHGSTSHAVARLLWCLVPVAVTVQFAAAVGRAHPARWPRAGLAAVGLGRTARALLSAAMTALVCIAGSAVALLLFLQLRGDVTGVPWDGVGPGLLAAGRPLPLAGALTLLAVVPVAAAAVAAAGVRAPRPPAHEPPGSLPWGVTLVAVGLSIEVAAPKGEGLPLPSGLGVIAPVAVCGWTVTAAGLMLSGPGLVYASGRLLAVYRPGAVRLLAGRALQYEARAVGRPLGLLCATASAALSAYTLGSGGHTLGPVTAFGFTLVAVCVLGTAAVALSGTGNARPQARATMHAVAASPAMLRAALALRGATLLGILAGVATLVASLSTLP